MRSFDTDLNNPFDDVKITDTRIEAFTGSLLTKLGTANTSAQFDVIIAAIEVPYDPLHTVMLKLVADRSITAGQTETRVQVIEDFIAFASKYQGTVELVYELNHTKLIEFYLHGMEDFNAMNKSNALSLISAFALAISNNHTDWDTLFPLFVSVGEAFPARYTAALDAQDDGKTTTGTDKSGRNINRPALNLALLSGYNYTKYYYDNDATAIKAIWIDMQALIPTDSHTERETNKGPIAKMALVNAASGNYDATYYILVRNVGTTKLRGGLQATATEAVGALGKNFNPGKSKSYQLITLGAPGAQFFNIMNTDLNNPGEWEIEIYTKV